jgi:hypothetical protein
MACPVRLKRNSVSGRVTRCAQKTSGSFGLVSTASQLKTLGRNGGRPFSAVSWWIGAAEANSMECTERAGAR